MHIFENVDHNISVKPNNLKTHPLILYVCQWFHGVNIINYNAVAQSSQDWYPDTETGIREGKWKTNSYRGRVNKGKNQRQHLYPQAGLG